MPTPAKSTPAKPAPRGTRALTSAILAALEGIPEVHRKAAFRHATVAVREKLIAQSEKAKAAARRAPALPGAKRRAAVASIREDTAREDTAKPPRATARRGRSAPAG
ncbi:hypothetical protein [Teichococcus aestuarii]|uniref:Uncharacterized protein n=1 Tax=Teichococcus aestuarii TaxID=568898 RepID=A0A2U1V7C3_9PROT|nr:hypothetical protein [Pseudoroseomonas aestuarii]PWC29791.1 hypothetical protein CR165_07660 [Pseudoroseomonas aestuarii]